MPLTSSRNNASVLASHRPRVLGVSSQWGPRPRNPPAGAQLCREQPRPREASVAPGPWAGHSLSERGLEDFRSQAGFLGVQRAGGQHWQGPSVAPRSLLCTRAGDTRVAPSDCRVHGGAHWASVTAAPKHNSALPGQWASGPEQNTQPTARQQTCKPPLPWAGVPPQSVYQTPRQACKTQQDTPLLSQTRGQGQLLGEPPCGAFAAALRNG